MTIILNSRDIQLQSTVPRTIKMGSDYIKLDSPYQYFKISESGTSSPTSIAITATLVGGLVGTPVFTVESGTATITQSNNICTIQYSNMSTDTITILASLTYAQNTYETRYTISKVRDGAAGGYTLIPDLLSEADVVSANNDGTGYLLPSGNAVKLYRGESIVSGGVTYSISEPSTKNGLTASINSSGAITLSGTSWTSDTETFTFIATYSTVPYPVLYTIAKSKAGSDAIIVDLVSENDVVATANDGSGYTLPNGNSMRLYKGGIVLSSGVTYSGGTTKSGLTLAIDSTTGAITLSGATWSSNNETFTLTAAYSGVNYTTTYKITKAKAGSTGSPGPAGSSGPRGSVRLSGTAPSAAWSDTTANAVLTNAGYGTKVIGDIVTLSYSTTWTLTKFWDGSAWVVLSELIDGNLLVTGSIAGNKIAANTITADRIDSRGLSIKDANGNVILAAGTALSTSNISGLGTLATQNSVTTGQVSGLGAFATLSQITSANVGTYLGPTAISSAYIGSLSADKISGGTITTSSLSITSGNGSNKLLQVAYGGYTLSLWNPAIVNAYCQNLDGTTYACWAQAYGKEAVYGQAYYSGAENHGVRGRNSGASTSGLVGAANGYNFYADGASGADYGTFTGAHDVLVHKDLDDIEIADIVVDTACLIKTSLSNVLCTVAKSTMPNQKGTVGVLSLKRNLLANEYPPAAFNFNERIIDDYGTEVPKHNLAWEELKDNYYYHTINALGEGQINVCGENGDLEIGDLIVTSSIPGKGMRQSDDIIRSYTVAKVREPVVFDYPTQVKMVACIYLCG